MAHFFVYNKEKTKEVFLLPPYIFKTRVSYADIDADLNLSLSGAMRMMQEAAIIHSSKVGYSVTDVDRTRVIWMLVQWRVRITGKAVWDDPVDVVTWPQTMEKATSNRCFLIQNSAGEVIAKAESSWLLASADTGRVMRIPPEVAEAYELLPDGVFDEPMTKLAGKNGEKTYVGTVLRRDIDTNHHVNNLVYLDYAREAMPEECADKTFPEVIVRYHRQLLKGDPIHCYYKRTGDGHLVQICGEMPEHLHGTVLFLEK